ncbi:unnamed protein product [Cyprideis torosa]|uniref:Uncharacterized protein n=1 Tax=Cyprideis torosa TaxID=163714 RepID=A0A7R8ZI46_9CRUS|nr:unnamed protein product [Cyprideis torosa]CAG0883995.1 unnamed protein product [Cyprideis torosa]
MSEYWVSQQRRFCEFCNCWMADNKISIQLHEGGKRHKDAVEKKLRDMRKKNRKEDKEKASFEAHMARIEEEALAKAERDVASNPSLASAYGAGPPPPREKPSAPQPPPDEGGEDQKAPAASVVVEERRGWFEVKHEEGGQIYYWNTDTGETRWDPPESYVSLREQEGLPPSEEKSEEEERGTKRPASPSTSRAPPAPSFSFKVSGGLLVPVAWYRVLL